VVGAIRYLGDDSAGTICAEVAPQSAARACNGALDFPHDDFEASSTARPDRALFTFLLFIFLIATLELWGVWKLMSLAISSVKAHQVF
jgi:hypothetical protein